MLNTLGGKKQFDFLKQNLDRRPTFLNSSILENLQYTKFLSINEKIEILELFLGFRFLTEAMAEIKYLKNIRSDGLVYPTGKSVRAIDDFINTKLKLVTFISRKKSKRFNRNIQAVMVFSNEALKEYFVKFEKQITSIEIGILYGYHPKAILAFCGYIQSVPPKSPKYAYQYYNSKVYPKDFYNEVDQYHKSKWDKLKAVAPGLIAEAELEFKNIKLK